MREGELLCHPAAPRQTQDVYLGVPELLEHCRERLHQPAQPVRTAASWRTANAGGVESDQCPGGVERVNERLHEFEARADPVHEQQRRSDAGAGIYDEAKAQAVMVQLVFNCGSSASELDRIGWHDDDTMAR